ncbi:MAG: ATP-binding protein [Candidatus Omnitrophota bacterium]
MDIRIVAVRTVVFLLVYVPILFVPFLIGHWFGKSIGWFLPTICGIILAPSGLYLYLYIQKKAENKIREKKLKYLKAITVFMDEIKHVRGLSELIDHVLEQSKNLIGADNAVLYLQERNLPKYTLKRGKNLNKGATSIKTMSKIGSLAQYLMATGKSIILDELKFSTVKLDGYTVEDVEKKMAALGANIVIPSFFGDDLISFMVLDKQTTNESYDNEDIEAFDTLGTNVGLALKNAQAMEDLRAIQVDLIASERFAAIGRLATSAKHEINNPLNFISGSMQKTTLTMNDYKDNYAKIRVRLKEMYDKAKMYLEPVISKLPGKLSNVMQEIKVVDEAFKELEEGGRIKESFNKRLTEYNTKILAIKEKMATSAGGVEDKETKKALEEAAHLVRTISINLEKIVDSERVLKEMVEYGQQGVERIKKVVDAMYNLPKDVGEIIEAVKITDLIDESFNFVNYQTYWENLVDTPREVDVPESLPPVAGYKSKLVGVFSNLIINAYQAMTDSGLSSRDKRMIKISAKAYEEDPRFIDIHFANKGPLIPEDNIDRIFDQGFTTKKTGTGLGLNICKIQIEIFNKGSISVRNIEGFGPEFIVRLPVWSEIMHGRDRDEGRGTKDEG